MDLETPGTKTFAPAGVMTTNDHDDVFFAEICCAFSATLPAPLEG